MSKGDFSKAIQWGVLYVASRCNFDDSIIGNLQFPIVVLRVEDLPRGAMIELQLQGHIGK